MALFTGHTITPDSALGGKIIDRSLRFNGDDTYLTKADTSTTGNRSKWTWSAWVKRTKFGTAQDLYSAYDPRGFYNIIRFGTDDQLNFQSNSAEIKKTNRKFRDSSSWYHIVVAVDTPNTTAADRIIIYVNGSRETFATDNQVLPSHIYAFNQAHVHTLGVYANASSYNFDGYMADIHFRDGEALDPTYFGYTESQTGMWLPKPYTGTFTNVNSNSLNDGTTWNSTYANAFNGTPTDSGAGDGAYTGLNSTFTINFPGSGVVVNSSLQFQGYAPASSQSLFDQYVDIYVNGTERTCTIVSGSENGSHSAVHNIDFTGTMTSLRMQSKPTSNNGISQVIVDGEILVNGLNARGNNSYHIDFTDNSGTTATTLGKDISGNANNYTPNNFSVASGSGNDSVIDTPTNNFCTLNPLSNGTGAAPSNGNLDFATTSSATGTMVTTTPVSSGKWYCEATITFGSNNGAIGIRSVDQSSVTTNTLGNQTLDYAYRGNGQKFNSNSKTSYGSSYTTNDVIGIALDLDGGTIKFFKNNSDQGTAFSNITGTYVFAIGDDNTSSAFNGSFNFGQQPFVYTPPTGHRALNSKNRATPIPPSVVRPQRFFETLLWTGNGSTGQNITGLEFKPDLLWIKKRNESESWGGYDSVRGVNKRLYINDTNAEETITTLSAFSHGGFRVEGSGGGATNDNGDTYVGFCWKGGGSSNTFNVDGTGYATAAAAGITDGNVAITGASVNRKNGFSVVTYTGSTASGALTVGHGLNKKPAWVLIKRRDDTGEWIVGHKALATDAFANNKFLKLDSTSSTFTNSLVWGAEPTTTVTQIVSNGAAGAANLTSSGTYVMYSWAEIPGFSKFGSYTGNGSSDGTYVHLDFRPAFLILRRTDDSKSWFLWDNKRDPFNLAVNDIYPNQVYAENNFANNEVDLLSNGFKLRNSNSTINASGGQYIYMVFAEQPNKTMFGLDANAR